MGEFNKSERSEHSQDRPPASAIVRREAATRCTRAGQVDRRSNLSRHSPLESCCRKLLIRITPRAKLQSTTHSASAASHRYQCFVSFSATLGRSPSGAARGEPWRDPTLSLGARARQAAGAVICADPRVYPAPQRGWPARGSHPACPQQPTSHTAAAALSLLSRPNA